ncbi:MAG: helicase, partial [Acetobacteraceae bacterium]
MIDRLRDWLSPGASLDLMSPTFSVNAFAEVRDLIERADNCRLLLGDEAALAASLFGGPADIAFRGQLQGRWLARLVADWIEKRTEVRCAPTAPPQSLIVVQNAGQKRALLGTCSFTSEGLGITPSGQLGLVQSCEANDEAAAFADWFRANWDGLK